MSEAIQKHGNRNPIHWRLLTGVSVLALTAYVSSTGMATAEDSSQPQFWIELGGQLARNQTDLEPYLPPFVLTTPRPPFETISPQSVQKAEPSSWDGNAGIAFRPTGSDWIFSAAFLYGKANRDRSLRQQTANPAGGGTAYGGVAVAYQIVTSRNSEDHAIADFHAGRDFGLGMGVNSTINFGIRYVQFNAKSDALIQSWPTNTYYFGLHHRIHGHLLADRKFDGIGPSLSWDATAALAGSAADGEIAADWGFNGALLFGRQTVRGHHQTTNIAYIHYPTHISHLTVPLARSKQVTVPNLGGFAGMSWRSSHAKVSIGYRADFFFGAMDGGIDTAHRENVGFYGPFATISVGIGG
ncbi:MAG TPA: hypothetical protein VIJ62_14210 [Rhizomicrobium sp.]